MADEIEIRIGDRDRQAATDRLREAYGEGSISLEELDERLEAVMGARTRGDIAPLLADLPPTTAAPARPSTTPAGIPTVARTVVVLVLVAAAALGVGRLLVDVDALALFGSQQIRVEADESVDVLAIFGSVEVNVPAGVVADVSITPIFGSAECDAACTGEGESAEIGGLALFGSVQVNR